MLYLLQLLNSCIPLLLVGIHDYWDPIRGWLLTLRSILRLRSKRKYCLQFFRDLYRVELPHFPLNILLNGHDKM
jgi:hypothetical protein